MIDDKVSHDVTMIVFFLQWVIVVSLYFLFLMFSVFGYLPYPLVVIFNEILKIGLLTALGMASASSFLQVAIIKNMRSENLIVNVKYFSFLL